MPVLLRHMRASSCGHHGQGDSGPCSFCTGAAPSHMGATRVPCNLSACVLPAMTVLLHLAFSLSHLTSFLHPPFRREASHGPVGWYQQI